MQKFLLAILTLLVAGVFPVSAYAARTSVDWVNLSGTTYIQPNFGNAGVDLLILGSNRYLNFNTVTGTNGYGFRDNAGIMQFKNSGGSWTNFGSGSGGGGGGSGSWSTSTSPVTGELFNYPNNTSDIVVIGATATSTGNYWIDPNTNSAFFKSASTTNLSTINFCLNGVCQSSWIAASSTLLIDNNTFSGTNTFTATTSHSAIKVTPTGSVSASVSVGGAFNMNNTANDGAGMVIFTNHGSGATGRLTSFDCNAAAFDQNCVNIQSGGAASTLNISGANGGLGVIKVAGLSGGTSNNNGSMISIDSSVNSFQGQGIFAKCNSATTTPCLVLRDASSNLMFSVDGNKLTTFINGSSSQQTISGSTWLTGLTSKLLATDQNGLVTGTTTLGTNMLTGGLGTINGQAFSVGGAITVTAASTSLSDNNTWSGLNVFQKLLTAGAASTTNLTASNFWIIGQAAGCAQFDANSQLSSTGTNCGSGGGSGVTAVATSSSETAGFVPYWTSTNGTPALLSGGNSGLQYDGARLLTNFSSTTILSGMVGGAGSADLAIQTGRTSGNIGGSVSILTSSGSGSNKSGGAFSVVLGNAGGTSGFGGSFSLTAGNAAGTGGTAGTVSITSGNGAGSSGRGGNVIVTGGTGNTRTSNFIAAGMNSFQFGTSSVASNIDTLNSSFYTIWNSPAKTSIFDLVSSASTTVLDVSDAGALTQAGGASSTFSNGINLSAGCFSVGGTCIGAGGSGGSGTVAGTGSAGQIAYYTGATTVSPTSTLFINNTTSFVGFGGTTSPMAPVTLVQTGGLLFPDFIIDGSAAGVGAEMALNRANVSGTESNIDFDTAWNEDWQLGEQNNGTSDFELWDGNDNPVFTINKTTLDVNIGTTTCGGLTELCVWGDQTVTGENIFQAVTVASTSALVITSSGATGITDQTPDFMLEVASSSSNGYFGITSFANNNTRDGDLFSVLANGRVTIGTTTAKFGSFTIGSSTNPQLMLSDNNPANFAWSARSINNNLYFATSTALATSTSPALTITSAADLIIKLKNAILTTDSTGKLVATTSIGANYITGIPAVPVGANPTVSVGLSIVNGSASTFMRSDAAPALDQTIAPTMTGVWAFSNAASTTVAKGFSASSIAAQYFMATSTLATSVFKGAVAISTTTTSAFSVNDQYGTNILQVSTASSTGNIFEVDATSSNLAMFAIDLFGHVMASSTGSISLGTCTGGATITAGSNEDAGSVTLTTAVTSCAIIFQNAYATKPKSVQLTGSGTVSFPAVTALSTTGFTIGVGAAVTGDTIYYTVIQ